MRVVCTVARSVSTGPVLNIWAHIFNDGVFGYTPTHETWYTPYNWRAALVYARARLFRESYIAGSQVFERELFGRTRVWFSMDGYPKHSTLWRE